ncbi:urea ABC transporter ATP-binding subunit UrtE [Notoacmeibacter sp. MSK16QG-6]|uniref:urea ABC transporter ATP-binding subunit UrtE n=1 Tax=Notoacmeibacter sp. MSK16QG-6 TaxID=2957982 RepID=UPI0020A1CA2D|nr:urea ABC transporter ATP-binding subunit UrtE [Notoacmeibacter sp. MSK16QG-6]MCP1200589.1 urea ABC transporter ATP-binding subunit UrtE [Notoacmeibacter sp. MSK16QG-6]
MLEVSDLKAFYGHSCALKGVSFNVPEGGFLAVLGRNGVGKTTLMRALLGLADRDEGQIVLDGAQLSGLPTHRRAHAGIGYVPQGRGILPTFSVRENLKLGTFARKSGDDREIDDRVFELFPMLKEFLDRPGGNLSGGQQQQLAIARAMLARPKVILLDEPAEGIQPNIVEQIEGAITTLNREMGITIVLVEQDISFARRASKTFALMEKGQLVASGQIDELSDELVQRHMAI